MSRHSVCGDCNIQNNCLSTIQYNIRTHCVTPMVCSYFEKETVPLGQSHTYIHPFTRRHSHINLIFTTGKEVYTQDRSTVRGPLPGDIPRTVVTYWEWSILGMIQVVLLGISIPAQTDRIYVTFFILLGKKYTPNIETRYFT